MSIPRRVAKDDRRARLRAGVTAWLAYLTAASSVVVAFAFSVVLVGPLWWSDSLRPWGITGREVLVTFLASWAVWIFLYATIVAGFVYRAPCGDVQKLWMLVTPKGHAVATLGPDGSRHARPGDVHITNLAAWRRGKKIGPELAAWLRDAEEASGGRLTAWSTRFLLAKYVRHGMFVEGKRGWLGSRIVSHL